MTLQEFVTKYNNKFVDVDVAYGSQCWDLAKLYAKEVVGCPDLPTGNGTALGVYTNFLNPLPTYFTKVANNSNPNHIPPAGALVFFNWSLAGHVAIVISSNTKNMTVFEQDGNIDKNRDGKADGTAYKITRNYNNVIGWFIPKKGKDMVTDKTQLSKMYLALLHRSRRSGEGENVYLNKDSGWVFNDIYNSKERATILQNEAKELSNLKAQITSLQKQLSEVKPDNSDTVSKDTNQKVTWLVDLFKRIFGKE